MNTEAVPRHNPMQGPAILAATVQASVRSRLGLFAQAYLSRTGPLTLVDIPDDSQYTVCSFLDLRDFNRLLLTCKREREVWDDAEVWTRLLRRDFPDALSELDIPARMAGSISRVVSKLWATDIIAKSGIPDAKQLYRQNVDNHRRTINMKLEQREQQRREETVVHRSHVLRVVLDILSYICGIGGPCAMLAVWLLLVMLKANGNLDIAWSLVWIPAWLIAGITILNCFIHLRLVVLGRTADHTSMWEFQDAGNSDVSLVGFTMWLTSTSFAIGKTVKTMYLYTMLALSFIVFPALVLARITGEITCSWGLVFLPVWLVFAGWLCLPCVINGAVSRRMTKIVFVWSLIIWLSLLIVSILVAARLNGASIPLEDVFIPFWVLDGGLVLGSFVASIIACADDDERKFLFSIVGAVLVVLGIGLTFTILGSVSDNNGGVDPIGFMVPMVASIGVIAIAGCAFAVRLLRARRRERFQSSWPYVCSCSCCRCYPPPPVLPGAA